MLIIECCLELVLFLATLKAKTSTKQCFVCIHFTNNSIGMFYYVSVLVSVFGFSFSFSFCFLVFCFWLRFNLKHLARTLKYFPAKSCTPIMAKISQNIRHTNSTLKMDGIACTSALTTT